MPCHAKAVHEGSKDGPLSHPNMARQMTPRPLAALLLFGGYTSLCLAVQLLLSQPGWIRRALLPLSRACTPAPHCLARGAQLFWLCWHKLRLRRLQSPQGGGRRTGATAV